MAMPFYCTRCQEFGADEFGNPSCCGGKSDDPYRLMPEQEVIMRACKIAFYGQVCPYLTEESE